MITLKSKAIRHPIKLYQLNYEAHNKSPKTGSYYRSDIITTTEASELSAKAELDTFLSKQCPEGRRVLIAANNQPEKEYFLVNPEVTSQLKRTSPEKPLPRINSDIFSRADCVKLMKNAEEITIQHTEGHLQNTDEIKQLLHPFLKLLRHLPTKNGVAQNHRELKTQIEPTKAQKPAHEATPPSTLDDDDLQFKLEL